MDHILDNPAWNALISNHQHLAFGNATVKHYAEEVSLFAGMEQNTDKNFQMLYDLLPYNGPIGFVSPIPINLPSQWKALNGVTCYQMIYNGEVKPGNSDIELAQLTDEHVPQMLALVKFTNPGPFSSRTIDFGHYYGIFEDDELVAMAGQRMHVNDYAEISAVCTHPDYLGKGYAGKLLDFQINRIIAAGGIPILHVRTTNHRAIKVYERVGFEKRRELFFYYLQKN